MLFAVVLEASCLCYILLDSLRHFWLIMKEELPCFLKEFGMVVLGKI